MIIGLVGEKLSGKDTVSNYLVEKYSAGHFRFTHILDDILKLLHIPVSRRNEIDLGLNLRKVFGNHILVNALEQRVKGSSAKMNIVNGIRMDEFEVIKSWPGAKIIYITAPAELRFERYKQRHEKTDDGIMEFQAFLDQEKEITEVRIPELGTQADFKIENVGTVKELFAKVDSIIKELKT